MIACAPSAAARRSRRSNGPGTAAASPQPTTGKRASELTPGSNRRGATYQEREESMIKPTRSTVTVPSQQPRQLPHDRLHAIRGGGATTILKPTSVVASDDWEAPNQT